MYDGTLKIKLIYYFKIIFVVCMSKIFDTHSLLFFDNELQQKL